MFVPVPRGTAAWDRAYAPVIQALGYEAVRADQDTGALILTQMLERLYFADLVLADMTIPNGNVYYEIGIRHAASRMRRLTERTSVGLGSVSAAMIVVTAMIRSPREDR